MIRYQPVVLMLQVRLLLHGVNIVGVDIAGVVNVGVANVGVANAGVAIAVFAIVVVVASRDVEERGRKTEEAARVEKTVDVDFLRWRIYKRTVCLTHDCFVP